MKSILSIFLITFLLQVTSAFAQKKTYTGSDASSVSGKVFKCLIHSGAKENEISSEKTIKNLGLDDLDKIEFIMNLEKEFNIAIPDKHADKLNKVKDFVKYVNDSVNGTNPVKDIKYTKKEQDIWDHIGNVVSDFFCDMPYHTLERKTSGKKLSQLGKTAKEKEAAQKIQDIIVKKLNVKAPIYAEENIFKNLNADELDHVELIMEFEKEFNFAIPDDSAKGIQTVKDAYDFIIENAF